ncbi:hypothetical protein CLIB1444_04S08020 [[Candida] jaroonii]|uniref:Uncharacterized protein n=1 Tax=[Candida] jaroonii TaxID=467808 RepID=A0ACA9Y703_9ASCO|nr:hypothetical protein CLIB1444_04S08020 [[Candida] jaroonii]
MKGRHLSTYETLFKCRQEFGYYQTFQVAGTYSNSFSKNTLSKVLRKVILENGMLSCNVFPDDQKSLLRPVEKITFDDVYVDLEDKYITDNLLNEEGMKFLNSFTFQLGVEKALFKVLYNEKSSTLAAVFDHAVFDGINGNYFHEEFIKYLRIMDSEDNEMESVLFDLSTDETLLANDLPPPIDAYMKYDEPHNETFMSKVPPYPRYSGRFLNTKDVKDIAFKLLKFNPDELKTLLKKCKEKNVTLTSYLDVIFALTFQSVYKDTYSVNKVAIALRKFIPWDKDYKIWGNSPHMGLNQNLHIKSFSWDDVIEFNKNLKATANNDKLLYEVRAWRDVCGTGNESQFFDKALGKEKPETTKLSNLGLIRIPKDDGSKFQLLDLVFSQDMSPAASDFMIGVVSTELGGLSIIVSYFEYDDGFDEGLVDQYRDNIWKYIQE